PPPRGTSGTFHVEAIRTISRTSSVLPGRTAMSAAGNGRFLYSRNFDIHDQSCACDWSSTGSSLTYSLPTTAASSRWMWPRRYELPLTRSADGNWLISIRSLDPIPELARVHLHLHVQQFTHGAGHVVGVAAEGLLALLLGGALGVADDARIGELMVVHREVEVAVALELD